MKSAYLSNNNYVALYLNTIGLRFASTVVLSFLGAHLFLEGYALAVIFLYFGLEFTARAFFTPLAAVLTSRIGMKKTILLSYILLGLYFGSLLMIEVNPAIGFAGFLLHAFSRGLYYPNKHFMQAKFIDESNRGRFITLDFAIGNLVGIAAIAFATFSVSVLETFIPVGVLAILFIGLAGVSINRLLDDYKPERRYSYKDALTALFKEDFRADLSAYSGFSTNIAFNNVVVALLVFFVVDSIELFGIVSIAVIVAELLISLWFGTVLDKNRRKSNTASLALQLGSYVSFLFAVSSLLVTVIKVGYNVIWNMFDSSFTARFHSKISKNEIVYACNKEMVLGFGAGLTCLVLAAVALASESYVFEVALVIAGIGAIVAWLEFKD